MHILLIEPDVVLAQSYRQALELAGNSVTVAGTAQAAIHAADTKAPDLVILELQLMSHSGIEFLYEFRSYDDWRGTPVIICSQVPPGEFADSQDMLQRELGVQHYMYKPRTTLQQLIKTVKLLSIAERR